MHIADIKYDEVLSAAFESRDKARTFVSYVEELPVSSNTAKIIIHQTARMIWLADRMDDIARGRPALQILFYIIAAEAVSKLYYNYQGERRSKEFVLKFFNELCTSAHRARLQRAFKRAGAFMTCEEAISFLYDIRCDVAHRGRYFELLLPTSTVLNATNEASVSPFGSFVDNTRIDPYISSVELRQIVIEGSICAVRLLLQPGSGCV